MNKNKIYLLEDRGLLYIQGNDVQNFLQNIIDDELPRTYVFGGHLARYVGLRMRLGTDLG